MSRTPLAAVAALATVLVGCGEDASESARPVASARVSYEIRGTGGVVAGRVSPEDGSFSSGESRLEFRGGRVVVNGEDCGRVDDGDTVLLDRDGRVYVNGTPR